jgi:hypothetical protein
MLGESMRELGVLILIFVPLDLMLEWNGIGRKNQYSYPAWVHGYLNWLTPQWFWIVFATVAAILLLYWGIKLETAATMKLEPEKGGPE